VSEILGFPAHGHISCTVANCFICQNGGTHELQKRLDEIDFDRNDLAPMVDKINPDHYKTLPVECIEVTQHMNFCLGNVMKYIWRCDHKGNAIEDLKKAKFYLEKEIERRERDAG
jgi:hypothetical protein